MDTLEQLASEIVGQWRLSPEDSAQIGQQIIDGLREKYRIEPIGIRIAPEYVKTGDRVRAEWTDGDVTEFTVSGPLSQTNRRKLYLLDRPDLDAGFVFPRGKGAIVRMEAKSTPCLSPALAFTDDDDGYWSVTGRVSVWTEQEIRSEYRNFEIVSDGSDR